MAASRSGAAKKTPRAKPAAKNAPARKAPARKAAPVAKKAAAVAEPAQNAAKKADKLLRDGFTIPKSEYAVLQSLKARAAKLGCLAKKSEVLRAGVMALAALGDAAFAAAVSKVPRLKTGRPAGGDR